MKLATNLHEAACYCPKMVTDAYSNKKAARAAFELKFLEKWIRDLDGKVEDFKIEVRDMGMIYDQGRPVWLSLFKVSHIGRQTLQGFIDNMRYWASLLERT